MQVGFLKADAWQLQQLTPDQITTVITHRPPHYRPRQDHMCHVRLHDAVGVCLPSVPAGLEFVFTGYYFSSAIWINKH